jgi:hypothetical protein
MTAVGIGALAFGSAAYGKSLWNKTFNLGHNVTQHPAVRFERGQGDFYTHNIRQGGHTFEEMLRNEKKQYRRRQ